MPASVATLPLILMLSLICCASAHAATGTVSQSNDYRTMVVSIPDSSEWTMNENLSWCKEAGPLPPDGSALITIRSAYAASGSAYAGVYPISTRQDVPKLTTSNLTLTAVASTGLQKWNYNQLHVIACAALGNNQFIWYWLKFNPRYTPNIPNVSSCVLKGPTAVSVGTITAGEARSAPLDVSVQCTAQTTGRIKALSFGGNSELSFTNPIGVMGYITINGAVNSAGASLTAGPSGVDAGVGVTVFANAGSSGGSTSAVVIVTFTPD